MRRAGAWARRHSSALFLVALVVVLCGGNYLWSARQQDAYEASVHRAHAARLREDQAVLGKLCLTFGKLAVLEPPAGNPQANPSRAYEQTLHMTLVDLGADLGCK